MQRIRLPADAMAASRLGAPSDRGCTTTRPRWHGSTGKIPGGLRLAKPVSFDRLMGPARGDFSSQSLRVWGISMGPVRGDILGDRTVAVRPGVGHRRKIPVHRGARRHWPADGKCALVAPHGLRTNRSSVTGKGDGRQSDVNRPRGWNGSGDQQLTHKVALTAKWAERDRSIAGIRATPFAPVTGGGIPLRCAGSDRSPWAAGGGTVVPPSGAINAHPLRCSPCATGARSHVSPARPCLGARLGQSYLGRWWNARQGALNDHGGDFPACASSNAYREILPLFWMDIDPRGAGLGSAFRQGQSAPPSSSDCQRLPAPLRGWEAEDG
jgi:hypothetical protein